MGVEKYGISTYGKTYLIDEGIAEYSLIRNIYILANVLLLLVPTILITQQYLNHRKTIYHPHGKRRGLAAIGTHGMLTPFFIAFTINNLIRGSHMIDHICRPVYYHEPQWAYAKVWITEMEIPTYANVLIQGLGLLGILKVMTAVVEGNEKRIRTALIFLALYIPASSFNIVHYTIEPPRNYGPFPNFNIAGSAITNIPIAILIVYAYKTAKPLETESTERLLKSNPDDSSGRKPVRISTHARRRSRTPVKN